MKKEHIIVTGAAGLIGANIVAELNNLGYDHELILVDHLGKCPHKWKNLTRLKFADYIEAEDFYKDLGRHCPAGLAAVFHLGAHSHTSEIDSTFLVHNNFETSKALARYFTGSNVRFVYASSAATYGDGSAGMSDLHTDISRFRPLNQYGMSKQIFDRWMFAKGFLGKPRSHDDVIWHKGAVGLKFSNVFGFPEFHKGHQRSLILQFYQALKAGKQIEIFNCDHPDYSAGRQSRDFCWVEDAAKVAVWFGLDGEGRKAAGLFNVAAGQTHTFIDVAKEVIEQTLPGDDYISESRVDFVEMPENMKDRYQFKTEVSIEKLRLAGYTEKMTSLLEAVQRYVEILEEKLEERENPR